MKLKIALLCGVLAGISTPAFAQTPDDTVASEVGTDEIIVNARRREENLQDVPVAVTAFNQDQLTDRAIASAFDLGKAVPGLTVNADSGNASLAQFAVRGKGQNFGASAGSVETYFAEVPLSPPFQTPQLPPQLFDLQSLQVLKGPQGTTFGRSTTGGAVLLVPQAPTDIFEGYGRLQLGTFDSIQMEGAINIPLAGDKAALRISGFHWQRDGYMHTFPGSIDSATLNSTNTVLPSQTFNNVNQTDIRATLLLQPTETLTNSTILTYHRDKTRSTPAAGLNVVGPGVLPGSTPNGLGVFFSPGYNTRFVQTGVNLDKPANHAWALINTTTFEISDALTLKNIFGYIDAEGYTNDAADADGSGLTTIDLLLPPYARKNKQITNEVQLQGSAFDDRFSWTVGGLADISRQPSALDGTNIFTIGVSPDFSNPGTFVYTTVFQENEIDAYSLFASGSYKLTDQLTVNGGYRHSWISLKSSDVAVGGSSIVGAIPAGTPIDRQSIKQQGDTYNFDLAYQIADRSLVYAGFRHGFKSGGFNFDSATPATATFRPETVDNFFIGSKNEFDLGGLSGRINIEGFYDLYKNMQVNYLTLIPTGIGTITTNVPKTTFRGIDLDWSLDPASWLTIGGAYTYIDAFNKKWEDTTLPGFGGDLTVNPVPYVSKHKLSATVRLHSEIEGIGEFSVAPSMTYQSRFFTTPIGKKLPNAQAATLGYFAGATNDADAIAFGQFDQIAVGGVQVAGYTVFDLRAEWNNIMGSQFSAAMNINNVTDKIYLLGTTGGTLIFGAQGNAYAPPRMVTFEVSAKF